MTLEPPVITRPNVGKNVALSADAKGDFGHFWSSEQHADGGV